MKKKYYILSIFLFATFLIITVSKININTNKLVASVPSSKERLHFLFTDSREEGDSAEAILVESNGLYGLIDAGNSVEDTLSFDGKTVYNYLKKIGVNKLNFILLTHDHPDHCGGIPYLVKQGLVDASTVFIYRNLNTNRADEREWNSQYYFEEAYNAMKKANAKMLEISNTTSANLSKINASYVSTETDATNHIKFNFGNFNFKLFNIKKYTAGDPEDRKAMIILMTNSGKKTLFTSEASNYDGVLNNIAKYVGKVDFEKIAHYDNQGSVPLYMLRKTSPDNILITGNFTSGKEYKFGLALALAYHNETNNFFMGNEDSNYPIVVTFASNGVKIYKNNNGNYTEITDLNITATPKKGWIEINDTKPILTDADINDFVYIKDGKMATGFITVGTNKEIYYLSETSDDNISKGVMVRGWKAINGKWYYFSNGKQTIYGNEYKDGQLVTGWFQYTDGRWYYLDPNSNPKGQMVTGFKKVNSKWYYFAPKTISSESIVGGQMMSKNVTIDGKTFTIGTNGVVSNFNGLVAKPTVSNCINPVYNGTNQTIINAKTGYSFSNNSKKNAGSYKVTATLSTGYAWSDSTAANIQLSCSIVQKSLDNVNVSFTNQKYTGSALTPLPTIKDGTKTLTKDTDYQIVSYSNNTNVGTASVSIKGLGNYKGTITATFDIISSESDFYIIDSSYMKISNDTIKTTLKTNIKSINKTNFINNINSSITLKLYDKNNNEVTTSSALVTTDSKIKYNSTEYKIIIYGDVDRDGQVSIKDLYQVYLVFKGKTTSLNNIQKLAADYDSSGLTDIVDLYKVYKKMKEK